VRKQRYWKGVLTDISDVAFYQKKTCSMNCTALGVQRGTVVPKVVKSRPNKHVSDGLEIIPGTFKKYIHFLSRKFMQHEQINEIIEDVWRGRSPEYISNKYTVDVQQLKKWRADYEIPYPMKPYPRGIDKVDVREATGPQLWMMRLAVDELVDFDPDVSPDVRRLFMKVSNQ